MGRRPGVSPEETRSELLSAAARVFARCGYEGASIADITKEAGLSRGAIYNSFDSKASLFAAVLRRDGMQQLESLMRQNRIQGLAQMATFIGSSFDHRSKDQVDLLVEAIVSSKRDPDIAKVVAQWFIDSEANIINLVELAQAQGEIERSIGAATFARYATMLSLGSLLVSAMDLPSDRPQRVGNADRPRRQEPPPLRRFA